MDFVYAKMILNAGISSKYTVAIGLYKMLDKSLINSYFTQFCAGGVLVSVPISILFMIMQKFYVEGITGGAVMWPDRLRSMESGATLEKEKIVSINMSIMLFILCICWCLE